MTRSEFEYSQKRSPRGARVVIILSAIGVALIAAWVLGPIALDKYGATIAAVYTPRTVQPVVVTPPVVPAPTATTATASPVIEEEPPPAPVYGTASAAAFEATGSLSTPWPKDPSSAIPAEATRIASVAPVASVMENAEPPAVVPLPRKRPSLTIAARLAIPLPRPRPEIEADVSEGELTAFERQVQRQQSGD